MTSTLQKPAQNRTAPEMINPLTHGRLPKWGPYAILVGGFVLSAIIMMLLAAGGGEFNWTGFAVLGAIFYIAGQWIIARIIEGARQATNRFENCSFARSRIQLATSAATESSASLRDTTNKYAPRSFTP